VSKDKEASDFGDNPELFTKGSGIAAQETESLVVRISPLVFIGKV